MIDNLELSSQLHVDDLRREARNERLAIEARKGQPKPKQTWRADILTLVANTLLTR